jgi:hypothetical protein
MRIRALIITIAAFVAALAFGVGVAQAGPAMPLSFRISFPASLHAQAVDGRVYVILAEKDAQDEPRFNVDVLGVPLWGKDVTGMEPGQWVTIDDGSDVYGYPYESLSQLPEGDYTVQAFVNIYTTVHRSDGHTIQVRIPAGDGGYPYDSPGNLYSTPVQMHLAPDSGPIDLTIDKVVEPADPVPAGGTAQQGNPPESKHVKQFKMRSTLVSDFWGTDMYLGATILLPKGYDDPKNATRKYPVVYLANHYSERPPFNFVEPGQKPVQSTSWMRDPKFSAWWMAADTPRFIVVYFRSENPYYDDSYYVNSANLGPYGDATVKELIPALQKRFRMYAAPWARTLFGGSTGGWIAAAQPIFYPKFWGASWPISPDPVDFRAYQIVNIYDDANAYINDDGFVQVPRPSCRTPEGDTQWTMGQENHWEAAMATHGRSQLGQWDLWAALFGPVGADGYPMSPWDKLSGVIDHSVADTYKPMDLSLYVTEHWPTIGKDLKGKLHFLSGTGDDFFLNLAVDLFQQRTAKLHTGFTYKRVVGAGHVPAPKGGLMGQLLTMTTFMKNHAPRTADTWWWRQ